MIVQMIVNDRKNYLALLKAVYPPLLFFIGLSALVGFSVEYLHWSFVTIPSQYISILGAAVGVFLAFRINSGYDRWWEARKIWGEIVNDSRAFAANLLTLTPEHKAINKIIDTHIAYINALRLNLRKQNDWQQIKQYFNEEQWHWLHTKSNLPSQINYLQATQLHQLLPNDDTESLLKRLKLMELLDRFYASQGKCERIKNTVFPWGYAKYTKIFVWLMAVLLPFHLVTDLNPQSILLCALTSFTFVTIEKVGSNLDNPFENSFNDTPMTTICRTIEIDLREMTHQKQEQIPPALAPKNGVLM